MYKLFEDDVALAQFVSEEMKRVLKSEEKPVFCLASGNSPKKSYEFFTKDMDVLKYRNKAKFVSLDEWVGVDKSESGSCYQMLHRDIFGPLDIDESKIIFYEKNDNLEEECQRIDTFINNSSIDLITLGVGVNGHIGLNEPPVVIKEHSSVVPLTDSTIKGAQTYFDQPRELSAGYTMGLGQIMKAKKIFVLITGESKKEIVRQLFVEKDNSLPAAQLIGKENVVFLLDSAAASLI